MSLRVCVCVRRRMSMCARVRGWVEKKERKTETGLGTGAFWRERCEKLRLRRVISSIPECSGSGERRGGKVGRGGSTAAQRQGGGLGCHLCLSKLETLVSQTHTRTREMTDKHDETHNVCALSWGHLTHTHACFPSITPCLFPRCGPVPKHTGRQSEVMTAGFWL